MVGGWYTQHHLLCRLQEAEHHSYQGTLAFILLLLEGPLARGRSLPHTDMLLGLFPLPGTSTEPVIAIYLSTGSSCSSCEVAGMASHCRGEGPEVQNGEVTCLWTDGEFRLGLELREDLWACFPVIFFKIFPFSCIPTFKSLHPPGLHTTASRVQPGLHALALFLSPVNPCLILCYH